jgi:hypothetical protein
MTLRQKERNDPLLSHFSNRLATEQFHSNQNSKVILNGQLNSQRYRNSSKSTQNKLMKKLISGETKKMMKNQIKKSTSRKNILKMNLMMRGKKSKNTSPKYNLRTLADENKLLEIRKKSKTISKLNLADCVTSRETQRTNRPKTLRKKSKKNKLKVDLAKLEKNLKLKKFNLNTKCLSKLKNAKKFKTTGVNRVHSQKQMKAKGQKKIRLSTYLKTERHKQPLTPKVATQVDLRQISLKMNKRKKKKKSFEKNIKLDVFDKITKESFNSLKLLQKSNKLSQEETLLILKSLESEKALRKIKKGTDIFFLKESKLKKRNHKKSSFKNSKRISSRKRIHLNKDIKFGTRNNNMLISKAKNHIEYNSEKKRY